MRKYILRALEKLDKLDQERLSLLVKDLVIENTRLEMVLSSIPGGVLVSDKKHKIIVVNNQAKRLLPLTGTEFLDRNAWDVIASAELSGYIREALDKECGAPMRDFPIKKYERNYIISCGVLPLLDNGKIAGNLIYAEDVTAVRAEELRLKRAESLASLTTMAAGVAHEIKNPLASMGIHIQLMKRQLKNGCSSTGDLDETIKVLEEEVERLNNIVSDYLFAVRPQASRPLPSDLNALIKDLVHFLRYELEEAKVEVRLKLDSTMPAIPLDEGSIKRALLNLIKNALAAMPDGGVLTIQTENHGDSAQISIKDTGVGIPEELQGKIFEPYFTTKDSGSGLGLTVVYKVVKDHGGDLHMESSVGRGTTFRITMPIPQREHKLITGGNSEI